MNANEILKRMDEGERIYVTVRIDRPVRHFAGRQYGIEGSAVSMKVDPVIGPPEQDLEEGLEGDSLPVRSVEGLLSGNFVAAESGKHLGGLGIKTGADEVIVITERGRERVRKAAA